MTTAKFIIACLLISTSHVYAATSNGSMKSSATMAKTCSISGSDVDFGLIDFSTKSYLSQWKHIVVQRMDFKVKCTNRQAYTLINRQVGADSATGCSITGICMKGSRPENKDLITYNVYRNSNLTDGWVGDGTTKGGYTTTTYSGTGNGAVQSIPHYFTVYSRSLPTPDNYAHTYVMELSY